ncbi:rhamnogalacturonan acetylesterase [Cerasicoccus arenae]|uniref:Rhamnogalacturonan acetylesterase RhgT n=1 Tax=Cerasicoccus arenae TaxID=424488 RepID=A0A8J3GF28_9BACT|nr:rhamnogalacturonan acetylesterase [Cerasicoccus arenae]MBK1858909.1 rhamnogalacturonan acetylesterase [Cerasicoccus arenae]GHC08123.1 rhamnogalacturonan acetylesterase RhgT [Cerasicoccus arenae]
MKFYFRLLLCLILCKGLFGNKDMVVEPEAPVIYMVGDSTMANKSNPENNPEHGWGQLLAEFVEAGVTVQNRAAGGRSTRSFIAEGRWDKVMDVLKPGDWVIIQFGHNDQKKKKPKVYTDSETDYQEFLAKFVNETRSRGAHPILVTSIFRRYFKEGMAKSSLGNYPNATKEVASSLEVPLIDLHRSSGELLNDLGEEGSKALFLHYEPGESDFYPKGKHDNSHLSEQGARSIAKLFAEEAYALNIGFPVNKESLASVAAE